jgi:hypothetical protein
VGNFFYSVHEYCVSVVGPTVKGRGGNIEEHKTTMKIEVRKTMNYEDYESILYSWIFVGTVGL